MVFSSRNLASICALFFFEKFFMPSFKGVTEIVYHTRVKGCERSCLVIVMTMKIFVQLNIHKAEVKIPCGTSKSETVLAVHY